MEPSRGSIVEISAFSHAFLALIGVRGENIQLSGCWMCTYKPLTSTQADADTHGAHLTKTHEKKCFKNRGARPLELYVFSDVSDASFQLGDRVKTFVLTGS